MWHEMFGVRRRRKDLDFLGFFHMSLTFINPLFDDMRVETEGFEVL